jgi:hypothetical protein
MTMQLTTRFNSFWNRIKAQRHITIGNFVIGRVSDRTTSFYDGFYPKFQDVEKWSLAIKTAVFSFGIFRYYSKEEANLIASSLYMQDGDEEELDKLLESLAVIKERRKFHGNPVIFRAQDKATVLTEPFKGEAHGD